VRKGNLAEISYDALTGDPVGSVAAIYRKLSLPDFRQTESSLRAYIASLEGYRRNSHSRLAPAKAARVAERWERFFASWGYPLEPLRAAV
jgi:hypothetical protein